jgi:chromosome partitioning protein
MRIRRRDRGEVALPPSQSPAESPEVVDTPPPFQAVVESPAAPLPPVRQEQTPPRPVETEPPPPFDQALLPPVDPPVEAAPTVAPTPTPPPVAPAPIVTPPPVVAEEPAPAPPPAPPEVVEESRVAPAPPPPPTPPTSSWEAPAPPAAPPVEPVVELPVEPKHAKVPAAPAPAPAASTEPPQMRTPSIRAEADSLLDGQRPAPRELPRVIAIANQKGGVGKTTTTVNLGAALAEIGYRVLVIDLDPQGNATTGLGIDARNFELSMYDVIMRDQSLEDCIEPTSVKNLFVAPATIDLAGIEIELVPAFSREMKLKRAIDTVVDDFDFILIDCPPSLGLITVNGLAAAGEVMVPIQCEYYALEGLSQLLRNVNLVSSNLNESLEVTTIVLTMFDARTRLSIEVANEVRLHFADRVCKSVIPRTVRLSEAPSFGQPITVFDPTSRGAVAYRELAKEVSNGAPQRTR